MGCLQLISAHQVFSIIGAVIAELLVHLVCTVCGRTSGTVYSGGSHDHVMMSHDHMITHDAHNKSAVNINKTYLL